MNYYDVAGILQTNAMQFRSLEDNKASMNYIEEHALGYIEDLIFELRYYKRQIKKDLAKRDKE